MAFNSLTHRLAVALACGTLLVLSAGASAASSSPAATSNDPSTKTLQKVRFAYGVPVIGPDGAAYTSVPKMEGFWKSEGLDVSIQSLNTGPAFKLLAEGKFDFLTAGSASGMPLVQSGAKIKAIAAAYKLNIFYPVVLPDSPITSLKQLKGKTVGLFTPAGSAVLMLNAILHEYGLTRSDLKGVVTVGTGAPALNALKTGQIDIYFGYQGTYNTIESITGVKFRRFTDDPLIAETAFAAPGIWTRTSLIQDNPQMVIHFLRGVVMGIKFSEANPAAAIRDHFSLYPHTKPQGSEEQAIKAGAQSLTRNLSAFSDPYGFVTPGSVTETAKMMQDAGIIAKTLPASDYYTGEFVQPANQIDMAVVNKALGK